MFTTRKGNLFALFFIVHFIAGSFIVAFLGKQFAFFNTTIGQISSSQIVLVLLPIIYYFLFFKTPIKDTLRFNKTKPINIILSILLALSSLPFVMMINLLSQFFVKQALGDTLENITQENYWFALIVIALFPALFEEMIARGILASHYRHKKVLVTAVMSGFFFGMMHLNINQFLYAFFLGFLFSIVVHLTGSIVCSMAMHFVINGVNLSLAFFASSDAYKALSQMQDSNSILESMDRTQILLQSLPIVFFLVVGSAPFIGIILFALATINNKGNLLLKNQPSYLFFETTEDKKEVPSDTKIHIEAFENESLVMEAAPVKNIKQPIITMTLIFTFIIFLTISILTEFM